MKLWIAFPAVLFVLLLDVAQAQKMQDGYYFFNKNWKTAEEKKAVYLLRINTVNDSCRQFSYYHNRGPLMRIETYRIDQPAVRQGLFAWYNETGALDSLGFYDRGLADKEWLFLNAKGRISFSRVYDKGALVRENDLEAELKEAAEKRASDSAQNIKRVEIESEFPGGARGWLQYLIRHQRYPDRAVINNIQGEVRLYFAVDTTGKVGVPMLFKSVEVSLDEQALSVVANSPNWTPASQDGRKVKSYKTQPLWYKLDTGSSR